MFVSVMKELIEASTLPPAISMHSFTGTAHHVKELLELEEKVVSVKRPLFFFGFSHAVNYAMCTSDKSRRKGRDAVKAVPIDRIVVESDVHHPQDVLGGTIGAISYVAWSKQVSAVEIAERSARNGLEFLGQRSDPKTLS
jgi:TatD DNase family protein